MKAPVLAFAQCLFYSEHMSFEVPKHEVGERLRNIRFTDRDAFASAKWVETLVDVADSKTYGDLRSTLGRTVFYKGGHVGGMWERGPKKAFSRVGNGEARYEFLDEAMARMTFFKLDKYRAHFQTPDEKTPNPAFVVMEVEGKDMRHVVHDPDERLDPITSRVAQSAIREIAMDLHLYYPGFDLIPKLEPHVGFDLFDAR
ncbi:MAG: hypothetical protein M3P98_00450 [bacterium]|nr:hypothetical protein [bacterium]